MYVVDASDSARLNETKTAFESLISHPKIKGKPILLFLNKQDIDGALDEVEASEKLNLASVVNKNKCPCRVVSILMKE